MGQAWSCWVVSVQLRRVCVPYPMHAASLGLMPNCCCDVVHGERMGPCVYCVALLPPTCKGPVHDGSANDPGVHILVVVAFHSSRTLIVHVSMQWYACQHFVLCAPEYLAVRWRGLGTSPSWGRTPNVDMPVLA